MPPFDLTKDEREALARMDIRHPSVRLMLASYLHTELVKVHGVSVPVSAIERAIASFTVAAPTLMDTAVRLMNAGAKPTVEPKV